LQKGERAVDAYILAHPKDVWINEAPDGRFARQVIAIGESSPLVAKQLSRYDRVETQILFVRSDDVRSREYLPTGTIELGVADEKKPVLRLAVGRITVDGGHGSEFANFYDQDANAVCLTTLRRPRWLVAADLGHELVHAQQFAEGKATMERESFDEVEAHEFGIKVLDNESRGRFGRLVDGIVGSSLEPREAAHKIAFNWLERAERMMGGRLTERSASSLGTELAIAVGFAAADNARRPELKKQWLETVLR
jgi:hypothetical protein